MEIQDILALVQAVADNGLTELKVDDGNVKLSLKKEHPVVNVVAGNTGAGSAGAGMQVAGVQMPDFGSFGAAGALAGTTYPLDRDQTAKLLGFEGPTRNSLDSVSDRDYLIEYLSDLSIIMMHLSRLSEEICIWNSNEYGFTEIDDAYSTGSSIMPQKKNPDIAELVRGKTGRVYGALTSLLTVMKGLPLAYNKDMQEDKELSFDAMDTVNNSIILFTGMIATMKFNNERMEDSAMKGFTNATDAADYLVKHGMPFRDAHRVIGEMVLFCLDRNISLLDLTLEEFKNFSEIFDEDIYDAISLETCVDARLTKGAPGPARMKEAIAEYEKYLAK